jgi:hypothetical protein
MALLVTALSSSFSSNSERRDSKTPQPLAILPVWFFVSLTSLTSLHPLTPPHFVSTTCCMACHPCWLGPPTYLQVERRGTLPSS